LCIGPGTPAEHGDDTKNYSCAVIFKNEHMAVSLRKGKYFQLLLNKMLTLEERRNTDDRCIKFWQDLTGFILFRLAIGVN
jgi:hypothetical protein